MPLNMDLPAAAVDLVTVTDRLDELLTWQAVQTGLHSVLIGLVLGIAVAILIGRFWR